MYSLYVFVDWQVSHKFFFVLILQWNIIFTLSNYSLQELGKLCLFEGNRGHCIYLSGLHA
jgi:hypothetical protein